MRDNRDLKELGISSFGHRRRLLNATTAPGGESRTCDMAQSATSPTTAPIPPPTIEAERRQLTVMFCDLVGSTALSTHHDPEDLRELIGDYHRAVAGTVGRFDGFVAKDMADGVLICFGHPRAYEDDAERAVRRARHHRRSDRCRCRVKSAGLSARRRILPRGCKRLPDRVRSSSPRVRDGRSARCSSSMI
jgi:class 3 adenylate cyclase